MRPHSRSGLVAAILALAIPAISLAASPEVPGPAVTPPPDMGGALPFEGTRWILRSYPAGDGASVAPVAESSITFEGGQVVGHTGCNGFGGGYSLDGVRLTLEAVGHRAALCEGAVGSQEVAVLGALSQVASWWRDGTDLSLRDIAGTELLRYLALEPRIWVPVWTAEEPTPAEYVRIRFSKGGFWGQAPCNTLGGDYTQDGSALTIMTGMTQVACPDLPLEETFLADLEATRAYRIDAGALVLLDATGTELRRFTEAGRS